MVKGIQRRLVQVKLRDSSIYESACFVLKSDCTGRASGERDLLEEANRIVASLDVVGKAPPKKAWGSKVAAATLLIVFGMLIGFSIGILL